jgi:hypothetical protein
MIFRIRRARDVNRVDYLLSEALKKRERAKVIRETVAAHREALLAHADELEREADTLEKDAGGIQGIVSHGL